MTNQAELFVEAKHDKKNVSVLMQSLEVAGIHSEQNWSEGCTLWTFDDDSQVKICGSDVEVM